MEKNLLLTIVFGLMLQGCRKPEEGLKVAVYQSFVAKDGLGPIIEQEVQKQLKTKIIWDGSSDGNAMVTRAKLVGEANKWDLIIGFEEARTHDLDFMSLMDGAPIVYDFAPMGLITRNAKTAKNLAELFQAGNELVIQDPRSSTPGATLFWFVMQTLGEEQGREFYCKKLTKSSESILPSWDKSYGVFLKQPALVQSVWSYSTSLYYHQKHQEKGYSFVELSEGAPLQKEYLAIPKWSKQKELAKKVIDIILSPTIQNKILDTNYMLPVTGVVSTEVPLIKNQVALNPDSGKKINHWMSMFSDWSNRRCR